MRSILSLFLAAALALSLTGCGAPPDEPSASVSADQSQVQVPVDTPFALPLYPAYSLHPVLASNRANLTLAPLLYEPLFQVDEQFEARNVLCKDYTVSEDGLTWTLTLVDGVTFSDGTPLTGDLVADALNLARAAGSRYAARLANILSSSGDGSTVTLTLGQPNGRLPLLLDIPIALGEGSTPAGTGPYVLSGTQEEPLLTARTGWWQDAPLPAREILLRTIQRSDDLIFAFSAGDVALVDVDLMGTNALGYSGNYEAWDYATTDLIYLGFNTQSGLCRTAAVRRALATAIHREAIAQTVYANHAVPAALPFHPDSSLYDETSAQALAYAPEELAAQVEQLRLSGRSLRLLVNSENTAKVSAAQIIAYQLESAGLKVELAQLSFEDYSAALATGDFDLFLGETVLTADFDLSPLLTGSLNYGRWSSKETAPLLSALAAAGQESAPQAAQALCAHLAQEAPIAAVCFKNGSVLTQWGRLSGLSPLRGNVFYHLDGWIIE